MKNPRQHPDASDNRARLIRQLAKNGQKTEAIHRYHSAISGMTETAANHLKFGGLALLLDLFTEAENHFKSALLLKKNDVPTLQELAGLYIRRGQISAAVTVLEQITTHDPGNRFARKQNLFLSDILYSCGINIRDINKDAATSNAICFPDIAYDYMVDQLLSCYPKKYEPVPKRYAVITFHMRVGGIPKKVANMVRWLQASHDEVEHVKLFCKSLSQLAEDALMVPLLKAYEIDYEEYEPITGGKPPFNHPLIQEHAGLLRKMYKAGPAIAHLALALMEYKPEVVHGFGYQTAEFGMAAAIAGVPQIVLHSGNMRPGTMISTDEWQDHTRMIGHAYQALARLPNITITNNCQAAATDYEQWLELPAGQVQVIYNGVDFDTLRNTDQDGSSGQRVATGIPSSATVIGSAIRFVSQKRPFLWLQTACLVAKAHPDIHFILVGDGPQLKKFEEEVRSLNLADRFHLPGAVTEIRPWYELMDIVLLTSSMEGTSNVAIEAQYLGIPVVSTYVGGMSETLLHGTSGWLVDPPAAEQLAGKINWILEHPEWRETAGQSGREFVQQQFSMEKLIARILSLNRKQPGKDM